MLLADKDFYKFDFDPLALKKKYLEERDKRRNDKGNDQVRDRPSQASQVPGTKQRYLGHLVVSMDADR
jgi:hypothetical protein